MNYMRNSGVWKLQIIVKQLSAVSVTSQHLLWAEPPRVVSLPPEAAVVSFLLLAICKNSLPNSCSVMKYYGTWKQEEAIPQRRSETKLQRDECLSISCVCFRQLSFSPFTPAHTGIYISLRYIRVPTFHTSHSGSYGYLRFTSLNPANTATYVLPTLSLKLL